MAMRMEPLAMPALDEGTGADARFLARWMALGLAAGAVGGALGGGVGGRLAMFVLRLTSPDGVRGVISDDGFEIGRVSASTLTFVLLTTLMGSGVGLIYVAVRGFLPARLRVPVWSTTGAIVGGALLVHQDGVDFRLLEPTWLACLLFVLVPALGAGLIAAFVERWSRWWCVRRRPTRALGAVGLLGLISPLTLAAVAAFAAVMVAGRIGPIRNGTHAWWGRALCWAGMLAVVALGARDLSTDLRVLL